MKKNLLLIGMNFYDYEKQIAIELENQGYKVDVVCDVPSFYTLKTRLFSKDKRKAVLRNHQKSIINKISCNQYEFVLVIVGRFLEDEFLLKLKDKCPNARLVLYLWDDIDRVENFKKVKTYYDKIYSFDPVDCYYYGFSFLPLFYVSEYCMKKENHSQYMIYSALSNHSNRMNVAKAICRDYPDENLLFYINMGRAGYMRYLLSKQKDDRRIHYRPKPIDKHSNVTNMENSVAILDVPFKGQVGLTIRTLETLGCGKKLITSNRSIQFYDFYSPENICIIDEEKPEIPSEFFQKSYKIIDSKICQKYLLKEWVKTITNELQETYFKPQVCLEDIVNVLNSERID